jgi:hypothetical protein
MMLRSLETTSKEKLGRSNNRSSNNNNSREVEQGDNSKNLFGIQEDFNSWDGELMSRSS